MSRHIPCHTPHCIAWHHMAARANTCQHPTPALLQNCPPGCCIVTHLGAARRPQPCCTIAHVGAAKWPTWALQDAPALLHHGPRGWPQPCCGVAHMGATRRPTWVRQRGLGLLQNGPPGCCEDAPSLLQHGPPGCCKERPTRCIMAHLGVAKRPQPAAKWPTWVLQKAHTGAALVFYMKGVSSCITSAPKHTSCIVARHDDDDD